MAFDAYRFSVRVAYRHFLRRDSAIAMMSHEAEFCRRRAAHDADVYRIQAPSFLEENTATDISFI